MIRTLIAVFTVAFLALSASAQEAKPAAVGAAQPDDTQRVKNWREDLQTLATELPAKHKNAFFRISKEHVAAAVDSLDQRLESLDDIAITLEFAKLVALIGDTHTQVQIDVNALKMHVYPVILRVFSDGLFVVAAWDERRDLLGAQVMAIDGKPADEVIKRVGTLFAVENESSLKNTVCNWIVLGEPLRSVGVSAAVDRAEWALIIADGSEKAIALDALPPGKKVPFVSLPDPKTPNLPIAWQRRKESYWFEMLNDHKALYVRYDRCNDDVGKSVRQFSEEVLKYIDEQKMAKVIIDLRRNSGGNSALLHPLIAGLASRPDMNQGGKLFVLTGRTTFSSAMMNAQELRDQTNATLIGEPTGGKPNHFGDIKFFELPYSKLKVQYSTKLFQMVKGDPPSVMPDVLVDMSSAEFFAGRDPVMEAVFIERNDSAETYHR